MSASSSAPPPPVAPPLPPPPFDRHARRNQRRADAIARRDQRQWLRTQTAALRRTSVLGPVLLLGLGTAVLFGEAVRLPIGSVLLWIAHGWPAVLVVAGMILLAEWSLDARADQLHGTVLPRRRLGTGAGFLLCLVVLAGLSAAGLSRAGGFLHSWSPSSANSLWNAEQLLGKRVDSEQTLVASLPANGRFFIDNRHGNILLSGTSPDDQVHVIARQHLWAWHDSELRERQKRLTPTLVTLDDGLHLNAIGEGPDETELTVTLPHKAFVEVASDNGEITATALQGELSLNTHHGQINLSSLTGQVKVAMRDKNASLTAHDLAGDIDVQGKGGDLSLSDIRGTVHLQGDFYGTTHLTNISNAVDFQSTRSEFRCASLPGELTIQGREVFEARDLRGPIFVSTSDRDVVLERVTGTARIINRKGDVSLGLMGPLQPVEMSTTEGDVHLTLPGKPDFNLDAHTDDGDINNDFGASAHKDGDDANLVISGKANAPTFSLRTNKGEIEVRSSPAADLGSTPH